MGGTVHENLGKQQEEVRGDRGNGCEPGARMLQKRRRHGGKMQSQGSGSSHSEGQGGSPPHLEASGKADSGKTTALHRKFQGEWLLSGFCHKKAKQMFTEMAECVGHFPMTDHTEKDLGWEMAVEEGCTESCGAEGAGVEGSLGLEMMLDTVGTHRALRQEGSSTLPPAQGTPGQSGILVLEERGPFQTL